MDSLNPQDGDHSQGADLDDHAIDGGTPAVSSTKRGPSKGPTVLLDGRKRKVITNELGHPNGIDLDGKAFSTAIGVNNRKYIPITHLNFRVVSDGFKNNVLQDNFDYDDDLAEYLQEKMSQAWRNHKHNLHKNHIKGKNLASVRAVPPPPFVNTEQWLWFVEYTRSARYQASSKRNITNRSKLRAPNTLGRRSMAVTCHLIAEERKLKSDLEVGRAEVYIRAHTKKDKTIQCPEIVTLGKDKSGRMRGMGAGISSTTMVKKTYLLLRKHEVLRAHIPNTQLPFSNTPTAGVSLRQPSQMDYLCVNKTRDLHIVGGLKVGSGEIVAVDPKTVVHNTTMGEGVFKILVTEVVDNNVNVFFPNDFASSLGEDGVHVFVTWPTAFLKVPQDKFSLVIA
ncbi:hypothetical protein IFM89_031249 [Coptis chinensis]|uniref:Transposase Tnp1/En/Spm-like domain-containing protein n=1 Tax=Coptis chinensis TaxID=261450 RepID=A0A835IRL8_9MAGN|nr:hypothetical protein IFM89_031249 [Coptis chinensis]